MDAELVIRQLVAEWHRATAAGDVSSLLNLMADDVVFLTPGQMPMRGRDAFGAAFEAALKSMRIESTGEIQEVVVSGDVAYCWTQLSVTISPRSSGAAVRRSGPALTIFRKKTDGTWVLARDANMLTVEPGWRNETERLVVLKTAQWLLRLSLAIGFLSAVADRFGLWGPPGADGIVWGAWTPFVAYVAKLNWFAPSAIVPLLAWVATIAEVVLAVGLLLGWQLRWVAFSSGLLLLAFALTMMTALGIKAPFDYSVFAASAGAFLLAVSTPERSGAVQRDQQ